MGNSRDQRAAEGENLFREPRIFFRIDHVDSGAKDRERLAFGRDRAAMAGGVDAARHTANNDESLRGEIAGQPLGHARSIRRGMARPDHRDAGLGQQFRIAAHTKDQRRIVNFFQPRRIARVFLRNHCHFGGGSTRNLFASQFRGLAGSQRLRGDRLNAGGLEFRQRGAKDGLDAAQVFDELPGLGRAEAGSQGNGKPFQNVSRRRRCGGSRQNVSDRTVPSSNTQRRRAASRTSVTTSSLKLWKECDVYVFPPFPT